MRIKKYSNYISESKGIPDEIIDNFQELEDDYDSKFGGIELEYKKSENVGIFRNYENGIVIIYNGPTKDGQFSKILNLIDRLQSFHIARVAYYTFRYLYNYYAPNGSHDKDGSPKCTGNDACPNFNYQSQYLDPTESIKKIKKIINDFGKIVRDEKDPIQGTETLVTNIVFLLMPND